MTRKESCYAYEPLERPVLIALGQRGRRSANDEQIQNDTYVPPPP